MNFAYVSIKNDTIGRIDIIGKFVALSVGDENFLLGFPEYEDLDHAQTATALIKKYQATFVGAGRYDLNSKPDEDRSLVWNSDSCMNLFGFCEPVNPPLRFDKFLFEAIADKFFGRT
jgi:hypothetical protein